MLLSIHIRKSCGSRMPSTATSAGRKSRAKKKNSGAGNSQPHVPLIAIALPIGAFSGDTKPLHWRPWSGVAGECPMPTTEEIEELREGFGYNDSNGDGKIDF